MSEPQISETGDLTQVGTSVRVDQNIFNKNWRVYVLSEVEDEHNGRRFLYMMQSEHVKKEDAMAVAIEQAKGA